MGRFNFGDDLLDSKVKFMFKVELLYYKLTKHATHNKQKGHYFKCDS